VVGATSSEGFSTSIQEVTVHVISRRSGSVDLRVYKVKGKVLLPAGGSV